jgi:hypothetical protein
MKAKFLRAILFLSLCIPFTALGQAKADSTDTEQAVSKPETGMSSRSELAVSKPTEQVVVRIYPNPTIDKVTYTFPAGIQKHLLQVTDMGGRTILNLIVGNIGTQNTINTSAWRPGIYFVSINSSTFSKTFKLMKQ